MRQTWAVRRTSRRIDARLAFTDVASSSLHHLPFVIFLPTSLGVVLRPHLPRRTHHGLGAQRKRRCQNSALRHRQTGAFFAEDRVDLFDLVFDERKMALRKPQTAPGESPANNRSLMRPTTSGISATDSTTKCAPTARNLTSACATL